MHSLVIARFKIWCLVLSDYTAVRKLYSHWPSLLNIIWTHGPGNVFVMSNEWGVFALSGGRLAMQDYSHCGYNRQVQEQNVYKHCKICKIPWKVGSLESPHDGQILVSLSAVLLHIYSSSYTYLLYLKSKVGLCLHMPEPLTKAHQATAHYNQFLIMVKKS